MDTIQCVKCIACERLHEVGNSGWLKLVARWERGVSLASRYQPAKKDSYGTGTNEKPSVVCDNEHCVLVAMGLEEKD